VADVNETNQDKNQQAEDRGETTERESWPAFTANQSRIRI
jgi:hypothetical protein